mgnify:FL=1
MYYHGFGIRFVEFSPGDGTFDAVFLVHRRGSDEILGQTYSIASALDFIRTLETQQTLPLKKTA